MSRFVRWNCAQVSISFNGKAEVIPAHRPIFDSTPSAPTTILALISISSPRHLQRIPAMCPLSLNNPVACVLVMTSAPASAADRASAGRIFSYPAHIRPHSLPAAGITLMCIQDQERIILPYRYQHIPSFRSMSTNSSRPSRGTPSAQRTGSPICWRFSIRRVSRPAIAASLAAIEPEGPAPTTTKSYSFLVKIVQYIGDKNHY